MIQSIRLQSFRSYPDDSFEFTKGVNIIVGPNASGKTNLLEALLVVARGSSYRAYDHELVMHERPWARLDALVDDRERIVKFVAQPVPGKTYDIDGRVLRKLNLERTIPVVLFEPGHLQLLSGSPERRREYLDELLSQTTIGYAATVRAYRRTLAQRNKLLKSGRATADQLFPWDIRLSELGGRIVRARHQLVRAMNEQIGELYTRLSQSKTKVLVTYETIAEPEQYESHMVHQLAIRHEADAMRGFTSFGPHREDMLVLFDDRPAEEVASRGEARTFVLGLKILELQFLETRRNSPPILLLDDVFSELDGTRRTTLTQHLQTYQTFITTTDADVVAHHFAEMSNIVLIAKG